MRLSQFLKLLSLFATNTIKTYIFALVSLALLTACNTEQHGGWKSKGGDQIPSFERSTDTSGTPSITARVAVQQIEFYDINQDVLLCEKTSSVKNNNLNLSYSIVGAMPGFELNSALNAEDSKLEVKVLSDTAELKSVSIKDLKLVEVKDSSSFIKNLLGLIEGVDAKLAEDLKNPIENTLAKTDSEISTLGFYKTADDGRKCYTANLLEENLSEKNISILDSKVFNQLSEIDQSILLLTSSLTINALENGSAITKDLINFVYYLHTEEFRSELEKTTERENIKKQLLALVESFIPQYGKTEQ